VRKGKKRKKRGLGPESEKTLLYHMNNNIRTFHRMQDAHSKLSILKESIAADEAQQGGDSRPTFVQPPVLKDMDDHVDDRPWRATASGLDLGEENSNDCLRWMSSKVLQHAGFHGD
jgi:transcriptional activator SPT7